MGYDFYIIYLIVVCVCGPLFISLFIKWLKRAKRKRKLNVKSIKRFEPLKTSTPLDKPNLEAEEAALDSVETRFSIIKKTIVICLVLIWCIALAFPFLNRIPATLISVVIGAVGVILGIAARPFIENMISGVVLSFSKTLRLGDTVIVDKVYGTVEDMTITHTVIKSWNWRRYLVPNSRMLTKEFINCTLNDTYQWAHVEFFVSYKSNLSEVKNIAVEAAKQSTYFSNYEAPRFWIMDTEKDTVKCWIAAWADNALAAWQLKHDIRTNILEKFNEHGIKTHQIFISKFDESL